MILVKIHEDRGREVIAVCDSDLIGKEFNEGKLHIEITENFFKGKEMQKDILIKMLKSCSNLNIVGKESIKLAFEAKLQLRPNNKEVLDFVYAQIENRNDCLIAKEEKLKTGIDLYLTSQKFTQILGRRLKKKFGGIMILSRSLYGVNRMTSKKVYRVTVLFRLEKKDI